jgi:hypothetical protein
VNVRERPRINILPVPAMEIGGGVATSGVPLVTCGQRRCELQRQALVLQSGRHGRAN